MVVAVIVAVVFLRSLLWAVELNDCVSEASEASVEFSQNALLAHQVESNCCLKVFVTDVVHAKVAVVAVVARNHQRAYDVALVHHNNHHNHHQ